MQPTMQQVRQQVRPPAVPPDIQPKVSDESEENGRRRPLHRNRRGVPIEADANSPTLEREIAVTVVASVPYEVSMTGPRDSMLSGSEDPVTTAGESE